MYAIFETGGKQYKVSAGDILRVEKIRGDEGDRVEFENVIAFSNDEGALKVGTPYLDAATVNATITAAGRGEKVIIFKFKAKKDYRRKRGHRQPYTEVEIDNFTIDGETVGEKPEKEVPEEEPVIKEAPAEEEEVKGKKPAKEKKPKAAKGGKKAEEAEEAAEEVAENAEDEAADEADEVAAEEDEIEIVFVEDDDFIVNADEAPDEEEPDEELTIIEDEVPGEEEVEAPAEEEPTEELTIIEDEVPGEEEAEAPAEEEKKEKKPRKAKAGKTETADEAAETDKSASKMTKADIMAKLDELGVEYVKSAKKDDLLALLNGAESK